MPIVVVSGTGDEFFLPDDSHMFFDDLPGDNNYMMRVCNIMSHVSFLQNQDLRL